MRTRFWDFALFVLLALSIGSQAFVCPGQYPSFTFTNPGTLNEGQSITITTNLGTTITSMILYDPSGRFAPIIHNSLSGQRTDTIVFTNNQAATDSRTVVFLACPPLAGITQTGVNPVTYNCGSSAVPVCQVNPLLTVSVTDVHPLLVNGNAAFTPTLAAVPNPILLAFSSTNFVLSLPTLSYYDPGTIVSAVLSPVTAATTTFNCPLIKIAGLSTTGTPQSVQLVQVQCNPTFVDYTLTPDNVHHLTVTDSAGQTTVTSLQLSVCSLTPYTLSGNLYNSTAPLVFNSWQPIVVNNLLLTANTLTSVSVALRTYSASGTFTSTSLGNCQTTSQPKDQYQVNCNPSLFGITYLPAGQYSLFITVNTQIGQSCTYNMPINVLATSCGTFTLQQSTATPGETYAVSFAANLVIPSSVHIDVKVIVNGVSNQQAPITGTAYTFSLTAPTTVGSYSIAASACAEGTQVCAACSTTQTLSLQVNPLFFTQPQIPTSLSLSQSLLVPPFIMQTARAVSSLSVKIAYGDGNQATCSISNSDLVNHYFVRCPSHDYQATGSNTVVITATVEGVPQMVTGSVVVGTAWPCGSVVVPVEEIEGSPTVIEFIASSQTVELFGYQVQVTWGDGTPQQTFTANAFGEYSITHVYGGASNSYSAVVNVLANYHANPSLNSIKCSFTQVTQTITNLNVPPKITSWGPLRNANHAFSWTPPIAVARDAGFAETLTASIQFTSGGATSACTSVVSNGQSIYEVSGCPSNIYTTAGVYQVTLTVTDAHGAHDSKTLSLRVV